jgi:hypothetical protein
MRPKPRRRAEGANSDDNEPPNVELDASLVSADSGSAPTAAVAPAEDARILSVF